MRLTRSVWFCALLALGSACGGESDAEHGVAGASAGGASAGETTATPSAGSPSGGSSGAQAGAASATAGADPGDATLASLTPERMAAVCAEQSASFTAAGVADKYAEVTCRTVGLISVTDSATTDADVQKACRDAYTRCAVKPPVPDDRCADNASCTATVSDYQACVAAYPAYLDEFSAGIPVCAELTRANLKAALAFAPTDPPACAGVWKQCGPTF